MHRPVSKRDSVIRGGALHAPSFLSMGPFENNETPRPLQHYLNASAKVTEPAFLPKQKGRHFHAAPCEIFLCLANAVVE
jgi:hypothetical protein